ncbi:MAG: TrmB family transcriptional regulator [Clostridium sp.]|jgi:HTH-type transcriptional regulator, sugar sensing transcriptional regulator
MVDVERLIQVLRKFNYTESEAKVYVSLLQSGPQTGYEVSKHSSVPRSKVYNVLESLITRGVVATTPGAKTILYRAEPIQRIADLQRTLVEQEIRELQQEAKNLSAPRDDEQVWKLSGHRSILEKCREMISAAERELLIQIWTDELPELEPLLLKKQEELNMLVILYDREEKYDTRLTKIYRHGFEQDRIRETGFRWITIAADQREMLHATIQNDKASEAIYTCNSSMVYFAEEYVRHDAYCLRIIDALPKEVRSVFGDNMEKIRDVFAIR